MKVQCEKCKAEYNIDEARVPTEGLQIKCPKCASTFIVTKGGGAPEMAGDLFDLGNVEFQGGGTDSLELDLPPEPDMPVAAPPAPARSNDGASTLPPIDTQSSSLPDIPPPTVSPSPTPGSEGEIFEFIDRDIASEEPEQSSKTTRYRIRRKSGKIFGPFDADTVKKMLSEHQLMGNEEASIDGHTFKPLGAFDEFAETIRLLMDEPAVVTTPALGPPASSVEEVLDEVEPIPSVAPKGIEFVEPPKEKSKKGGTSSLVYLLLGVVVVLVLAGVGLGFTRYGYFGYRLFSGGASSDSGTDAQGSKTASAKRARQLFFQDTHAGYAKLIKELGGKIDGASREDLYLLGLSYSAMLRNYGANEGYLAQGKKTLSLLKDEAPESPEARKVEAAFKILTNAAQARTQLEALVDTKSRDKEALFLAGWAMAYQKKWREAAKFFDRATVIDPDFAKAYHALGDIQSLQGDFDNALQFYEKALDKNPRHLHSAVEQARIMIEVKTDLTGGENILNNIFGKKFKKLAPSERAKAHYLRARIHMRRHENEKAAIDLNAAVQLMPARVDYLAALGEFQLDIGEYAKASTIFDKALALQPKNVNALVGKGRAMWLNGDIVKAKISLEKTAAQAKKDPRPLYLLGRIAEDLEKPREAMKYFKAAVKVAPSFLTGRVAMARFQLKQGKLKEAFDELTSAAKVNPNSAIVRNGLGEIHLKQGNLRLARQEFEEALRLDAELASAHFNLANVLRELGSYNQAIEEYKKVALISPKYPDLIYEHAYALYLRKNHKQALKMYEAAIRTNPKDDRLYVRAGLAADAAGDTSAAVRYFQSATGLDSGNTEAIFQLGLIFQRQKNYEGALELFKQILEVDNKNADAHYRMGLSYLAMEMSTDAIDEFRDAIQLDPSHVEALIELGKALTARLQFSEAIQHFNRVVRKQPNNVSVLMALGDAYLQQGLNKKALKVFQKAYSKAPKTRGIAYRLGRTYDDMEKRSRAVKFYQKAIKNYPKDPMPHFYMGHVFKARGATRKALISFKRYLQLRPDAPDADEVRDEIYYLTHD